MPVQTIVQFKVGFVVIFVTVVYFTWAIEMARPRPLGGAIAGCFVDDLHEGRSWGGGTLYFANFGAPHFS